MTSEERQQMMEEIMQVVDKHVAKSEGRETAPSTNKYGRQYGISDEEMAKWKREYRAMRIEGKAILEEVRRNPIDSSKLESSFDLGFHTSLLKKRVP